MKCFKSMVTAMLLCLCIGARAETIVTISSAEGAPDDEVDISIGLNNSDAVSTLQVSIPLGENLTFIEGSAVKSARCSGHVVTTGVKDGELHIFVYSMSMAAISGNSGEVVSFKLRLGHQPMTSLLTPSKTVLTASSGETINSTTESGSIICRCAKAEFSPMEIDFGEVALQGTYLRSVRVANVGNADLTISSLQFSDINVFSSSTAMPMTLAPGASSELYISYTALERANIERTLKVISNSVSKLNTIKLKAQAIAVNELHIQSVGGVCDEEVFVRMTMNNMDAISGYQVEFDMPSDLEYVDGSFQQSSRKTDHVEVVSYNDRKLRILVYSGSGAALNGNEGEIGAFKVKLVGRFGTTLTPSKTVLSANIGNKVENVVSSVYGGNISILSPKINCNSELDFGKVSVTESCEQSFTIYNRGSVPLTISRIVFNNEHMSVKEQMPIVIQPGESDITIEYASTEQKAFEATMQIYSNDPEARLTEVKVFGSRFAPNYLSIMAKSIHANENLSIDIALNTYDAISGLQFDVVFPGQYFSTFNNNYTLEERAEGMTATMRQIDDNTLRFFCFFLEGNSIQAGQGKIMSLFMNPMVEGVPKGNYTIRLINIKFSTDALKEKYAGTDAECTFEVKGNASTTLTAMSFRRRYGEENPVFTYDEEGAAIDGVPIVTCSATELSPVGEYPIIITSGSITNDDITYINGILTIEKAPVIVSVGSYIKKQGEAMPEFALSYEGWKNGDDENVLTVKPTVTTKATEGSVPGEYIVIVNGGEAQNYELSYVNGLLTVIEADPVVVQAKNYTRIYGDANPTFEYVVEGAVLQGKPVITCEATAASPVGTYDIIVSKGTIANYNVTYVAGTLTIAKAPLTISGGSYSIKQGDELPTFVASYEGWKNNETEAVLITKPTLTTTATSKSKPDTYDVIVSGAEAQNYAISYVVGKLTITPGIYKLVYKVDGEVYKTYDVEYGTTITPETEPTKEGYSFSGWSEIPVMMPAHDVTVTGTFTINNYKLTYKVDGEVYKTYDVEFGATITPEMEPTKEGYTFSGWSEIPATMPAKDVTVTGTFTINKYKLTYKVDGEVYKTLEVEFGATITPEEEPTKEGYSFSGWSEIPATMPAKDVTITGTFTVNKYKLTYKVDGEVYKTFDVEYGATITPEAEPTKEGYTFSGWSEIPATMPAYDVTVSGTFTLDTGIDQIMGSENGRAMIFTIDGKRVDNLKRGLNVIRMTDGTIRKVVVK